MGTRTARALGIGIAAIAATACGLTGSSSTTAPAPTVPDSSFAAAITGTITDSLTGPALFQEILTTAGTDSAFALSFGLGSQTGSLVFFRAMPGSPTAATYTLYSDTSSANPAPTDFYAIGVQGGICSSCTLTGVLIETSGTLTITSVTSTRIDGTFAFTGFEVPNLSSNVRDSIGVTGTFIATAAAAAIDTASGGPCSLALCNSALPYPIVERTASGDFVSNAWMGAAGSATGRAVNTRSQRAER
jgi:hypothetical protein